MCLLPSQIFAFPVVESFVLYVYIRICVCSPFCTGDIASQGQCGTWCTLPTVGHLRWITAYWTSVPLSSCWHLQLLSWAGFPPWKLRADCWDMILCLRSKSHSYGGASLQTLGANSKLFRHFPLSLCQKDPLFWLWAVACRAVAAHFESKLCTEHTRSRYGSW